MKYIIIDLLCTQPISGTKFHGGGEYTKSVFSELLQIANPTSEKLIACYNKDKFIDEWILSLIEEKSITVQNVTKNSEIVDFMYSLPSNCEIRFFAGMAYGYGKTKFPKNVYSIGTCHGLRMIEKPFDDNIIYYANNLDTFKRFVLFKLFKKKLYSNIYNEYKMLLDGFDSIIAVSKHTENAILNIFPSYHHSKDVRTYYTPMKISQCSEVTNKSTPYILMINGNRWIKNVARGALAIDELYSKGHLRNVRTKILGDVPRRIINKIHNVQNFDFLGYVDSSELEDMYKNCTLFFYPTLNEGFGLPPIEAMKYGKTCLISAVCSLTEVYGDSVYYCNPYDLLEMESHILLALNNPISVDKIQARVNFINMKQKKDTCELCLYILGRN